MTASQPQLHQEIFLNQSNDSEFGTTAGQNNPRASPSTSAFSVPIITSSLVKPPNAESASPHWKQFVPRLWYDARGVDVRITWVPSSGTTTTTTTTTTVTTEPLEKQQNVAKILLDEMEKKLGARLSHRSELLEELATWIHEFEKYCRDCLIPFQKSGTNNALTARIVCTRGRASTKCPKWHQDHVPFRWIQSLVGPGCEWIELFASKDTTEFVNRHNEAHDRDNAIIWGDSVVPKREESPSLFFQQPVWRQRHRRLQQRQRQPTNHDCHVHQAREGQAVLLLGNRWKEMAHVNKELPAVIHKSPTGLPPWQGRVLLTMDVVPEDCHSQ
ncbi:hypothetical protein ACA910_007837 [Epithemia clementina (nom. ined.)]